MAWRDGPLLGFDLETTGIDTAHDVPVQVALVWTTVDRVVQADTWLVDPGREIPEAAVDIHGISTSRARREGRTLAETAARIHSAVRRATAEGVPVVAMNANFDVTIAERLFATHGLPSLAWHALLDPLVLDRHFDGEREGKRRLDALCEHYEVNLFRAHDAGCDAEAAVALTRCIGRRFPECGAVDPESLTRAQAAWYAVWARDYDTVCRKEGLAGLSPEEFRWPCRTSLPPPPAASPERQLAARRHPVFTSRNLRADSPPRRRRPRLSAPTRPAHRPQADQPRFPELATLFLP